MFLTDLEGLAESACDGQLDRLGRVEKESELWQYAIRIMKEMLQRGDSLPREHFEDLAGPFRGDLLQPNVFVKQDTRFISFDSTIMKARAARVVEEIAAADGKK